MATKPKTTAAVAKKKPLAKKKRESPPRTQIGLALQKLRVDLKISVGKMAKDLKMSRQFLHGIEIGLKPPPPKLLGKVAAAYSNSLTPAQMRQFESAKLRSMKIISFEMDKLPDAMRDLVSIVAEQIGQKPELKDQKYSPKQIERARKLRGLFAGDGIFAVEINSAGQVLSMQTSVPMVMTGVVVQYKGDRKLTAKSAEIQLMEATPGSKFCEEAAQLAEQN